MKTHHRVVDEFVIRDGAVIDGLSPDISADIIAFEQIAVDQWRTSATDADIPVAVHEETGRPVQNAVVGETEAVERVLIEVNDAAPARL